MISEHRKKTQRGQALLEGALVTFTLLLMTIFVLDMGQLLMFSQFFSDRARVGARYASISATDEITKDMVTYGEIVSPQVPPDEPEPSGFFGLKPSNVAVTRTTTADDQELVVVEVNSYLLRTYTPFLAGTFNNRPVRAVLPVESKGATN